MPQNITRIKEVVTKRSEFAKHYLNSDGSYIAEICSGPIHYKDGIWKDIDTTVVTSNDPDYDFMNITNGIKTYFTKEISGTKANIKIVKNDVTILLKSANNLKLSNSSSVKSEKIINKARPQKENKANKIKFPSIYSNKTKKIDIDYDVLNVGIHEEFLVNEPMDFPEITQEITLINGYVKLNGKAINIYNKTTNKFIISLPAPMMFEQGNPRNRSYDLHYETSDLVQDTFTITKVLDNAGKDWFFSQDRVYPLIVDTDFVASHAYYVEGYNADYEFARGNAVISYEYMLLGQYLEDGTNYAIYRNFLKFDTSSIGEGSTITFTLLILTINSIYNDTDFDILVSNYDWSTYDPIDYSNRSSAYNEALGTGGNNWSNSAYLPLYSPCGTSIMDYWVNKSGSTYLSLISGNDNNDIAPTGNEYIDICNPTDGTPSYRPTLNVTYTVPASGPTNLKSLNSNPKSNIKSISGNALNNTKSLNGII